MVINMLMIGVDHRMVDRVSKILAKKGLGGFHGLDLFDEKYYPSRDAEPEQVYRYFLVMVAMDHRLSRPGKQYEACLDDGCYHGADLLYRLGKKMLDQNPGFYSPENLANISIDQVMDWLSVGEVKPPDPVVRAYLLRDLGVKLLKLYDGLVSNIVASSNNMLYGSMDKPGLLDLLKVFRAYEDPVEKKSLLFVKFVRARGLFNPIDRIGIPIDNHLTRIALRLGLVMISGDLWNKVRNGVEVGYWDDLLIRSMVRRAFEAVADKSGLDTGLLDDYLWVMGRSVCLRDKPLCDECLFKNVCLAVRNRVFMVNEHVYYNTWYY